MASSSLPWTERLRAQLPHGRTLPRESWEARHRAILILALFHAGAVPLYGIVQGYPVGHCLLEGSGIGLLVLVAWVALRQDRTRLASSAASVSLMRRRISASRETSQETMPGPDWRSAATTCFGDSLAKRSTSAFPMPLAAPVTTITRFFRSIPAGYAIVRANLDSSHCNGHNSYGHD